MGRIQQGVNQLFATAAAGTYLANEQLNKVLDVNKAALKDKLMNEQEANLKAYQKERDEVAKQVEELAPERLEQYAEDTAPSPEAGLSPVDEKYYESKGLIGKAKLNKIIANKAKRSYDFGPWLNEVRDWKEVMENLKANTAEPRIEQQQKQFNFFEELKKEENTPLQDTLKEIKGDK